MKQISTQSPIGASELLGKITRLITKERVVVAKPAFKEHAKITKVEASSDKKNYKIYIEVTTPINELYVVELRAANAHTTVAKRRISLDVAYNVREIVVEFTAIRHPINKSVFIDGVATPISPEQEVTQASTAIISKYKVGDYYDDGTKQGVVFEVSEDGRHGKIVSLRQSKQRWCSEAEYGKGIKTGATDQANGMTNQRKIEQINNWRNKYPAFAWCADQGEGWYLPVIEELQKIYRVKDVVNKQLECQGGAELSLSYWSSTEADEFCAWSVVVGYGFLDLNYKSKDIYVRAVSAF